MIGVANRRRLDVALTEDGMVESRQKAQALIMAGRIRVAGETVREPGRLVATGQPLQVVEPPPYVGRGGEKLAPVLELFGVQVEGRICADIGSSTGGFTDVLLQKGARLVYAVDVGRGLLDWRLRQDPRVVVMEGVNARHLSPQAFNHPVSLVTVDVSFIGLEKVLPAVLAAAPGAELVILFKPQFQVGRQSVGRHGVVVDQVAIEEALAAFRRWCEGQALEVAGQAPSPLPGREGNREILLHVRRGTPAPEEGVR